MTDRERASLALLTAVGNTQPSAGMVVEVVSWSIAEDTCDHGCTNDDGSPRLSALQRNNPWNTTKCGFNMIGSINSDGECGVGHYATMEDGIAANAATLEQANFADVRAALLANDPEGFKWALWASGWAASHYGYGSAWVEGTRVSLPTAFTSNPIAVGGDDCGWNVQVALEANGGALQHVRLAPGETFSFNATMGNPGLIPYRVCVGVPGGSWCNLAARYAQVSRALGLSPRFQDHGVGDLGGGPENSVAIWNEDGQAGVGQDLLIMNTTSTPIWFRVVDQGGAVVIEGGTG